MKREKIIIIGAGEHAEVLIDIIEESNTFEIIGISSPNHKKGEKFCGYEIIGDDNDVALFQPKDVLLVNGVAAYRNNRLRKHVFQKMKLQRYNFATIIHPNTSISKKSKIGEGVVMYSGVTISTSAKIGDNCILALNCSIGHHTTIENDVLISAGVNIGADVNIGAESLVGIGAKVVSGINVGLNNLIGAGGVVVKNTLDNQTLYGIPAKPI